MLTHPHVALQSTKVTQPFHAGCYIELFHKFIHPYTLSFQRIIQQSSFSHYTVHVQFIHQKLIPNDHGKKDHVIFLQ